MKPVVQSDNRGFLRRLGAQAAAPGQRAGPFTSWASPDGSKQLRSLLAAGSLQARHNPSTPPPLFHCLASNRLQVYEERIPSPPD